MSNVYEILERPLITEKSSSLLQAHNHVTFKVKRDANKTQIKEAVQKIFNVTVLDVNTSVVKGKWKRFGRTVGKTKNWKKAIVLLKAGDKIDAFEGA
jgi:large subunit ribosomal protein L23